MKIELLSIENLGVVVEGKTVVNDLNLRMGQGEVGVLLGSNGSGKSSLAMALMGSTQYIVHSTKLVFEGKDLLKMTSDERARAGLFVSWQNPVSIPGVSVFNLCRAGYEARGNAIAELTEFKRILETLAERVGLPKEYVKRSVNEGFSGGEKKRLELLQLLLFCPKLAILDEIDSGLDTSGVERLMEVIREMKAGGTSFILITHNKKLMDDKDVDTRWEMKHGQLQTWV